MVSHNLCDRSDDEGRREREREEGRNTLVCSCIRAEGKFMSCPPPHIVLKSHYVTTITLVHRYREYSMIYVYIMYNINIYLFIMYIHVFLLAA